MPEGILEPSVTEFDYPNTETEWNNFPSSDIGSTAVEETGGVEEVIVSLIDGISTLL
jgi:hypothetical protein